MFIQALKFHSHRPTRTQLPVQSAGVFAEAAQSDQPVVYVVTPPDADRIAQFSDHVDDRGTRHDRKGLKYYLDGRDRIALLRALDYEQQGRLCTGIGKFLDDARSNGEQNTYIIGINEELFSKLHEQTEDAPEPWNNVPVTTQEASEQTLALLPAVLEYQDTDKPLLGTSAEIRLVRKLITRAAQSMATVLIQGETGTGKEVVARGIHISSPHRNGSFVAVNCAAIPTELFESELFGHQKGAFTGAQVDKIGLWQVAQNGTLFLDEMGDLADGHQAKILRALEENCIRPIGGTRDIAVNARVIAATNRNLFAMVQAGTFRKDLYYRLRQFPIQTPALRNNPRDIPLLARALWEKITDNSNAALPRDLLDTFKRLRWPGNVRDLKTTLGTLWAYYQTPRITLAHFYSISMQPDLDASAATRAAIDTHRAECLGHLRRADEVLRAVKVTLRPLLYDNRTDRKTADRIRAGIHNHINEIEGLCLHPLLFHSTDTFNAVRRLNGGLRNLYKALAQSGRRARTFWESQLLNPYTIAQERIFQEVEKLTA